MKRWIVLAIVVLLASYVGFLIAGVPADLVVGRVNSRLAAVDSRVLDARGSAWRGSGRLVVEGTALGTLSWHASPWPLARGRLDAAVRVQGNDLEASGEIEGGGRTLRITGLDGRAALPLLAQLGNLPTALRGTLVAHIEHAQFAADGTLESVAGRIEAHGAHLPDLGVDLGTLAMQFTPAGNAVHGTLSNSGGDLDIAGQLTLRPGGAYVLQATLAPHAGQNRMRDALAAVLGAPDGQGRFHYRAAGRLGQ